MSRFLPCALLALFVAGPAHAVDPISVSVATTETPNIDHKRLGARLQARIKAALGEVPEFFVSGDVAMSAEEMRTFFACFDEDPACMSQVSAEVDARRVVWARIERKEGAWSLTVRMLDFDSRTYAIDETFTLPGGAERHEELEALAAGVIRGQKSDVAPTSRLVVDTLPPGADISVDGQMLGTTPLTHTVTRGRHMVEVSLPGRRTVRKQIDVGPGEHRETISLPIIPKQVTPQVGPVEGEPDWPLWAGIGAGAVAGLAATVGTVAWVQSLGVAEDARDLGRNTPAYLDRKAEYESLETVHLVSTVTAAAAGAAAVYFLVFHEEGSPTVTPTVSGDAAGAMILGRF